jgi:hypothetical protein
VSCYGLYLAPVEDGLEISDLLAYNSGLSVVIPIVYGEELIARNLPGA